MNKQQVKSGGIFFLLGLLTLIIAYFTQQSGFWGNIAFNIGVVIIAVAILNFLWSLLGGDPLANSVERLDGFVQLSFPKVVDKMHQSFQNVDDKLYQSFQIVQDCHSAGLAEISSNGQQKHIKWMERVKKAEGHINLMGYTLYEWVNMPKFLEEIPKLVQRNVKIQVLVMDQTNSHFESFINADIGGYSIDHSREELKIVQQRFDAVKNEIQSSNHANTSGSFELRTVKKGLITCSICRTDSQMAVGTYLYWQHVTNSPLMLLEQNSDEANLFQVYQDEFDKLWNLNP